MEEAQAAANEDELQAEAYVLGIEPGVATLVVSPDGTVAVGIDPARAPKEAPPRPEPVRRPTTAAQDAMRHLEAQDYLNKTVKKRRIMFLVLLCVDFCYFLALLIYQVVQRTSGKDIAQQQSITNNGGRPVALWIGTTDLRIELVVFSLVVDFVGWVSAVQPRTPAISIFCILQGLDTVLLSLRAATLFIAWRIVQLIAAGSLRTAIHTYQTLEPRADDDRAEGMYMSGREVWGITRGFFAILAGRDSITPEDRERRAQRAEARARAAAAQAAEATAAQRAAGTVSLGDVELGMTVRASGGAPAQQGQHGVSLGGAAWGGPVSQQGLRSVPTHALLSLPTLFTTWQVRHHAPTAPQPELGAHHPEPQHQVPAAQMGMGMSMGMGMGMGTGYGSAVGAGPEFQLRMDPARVRWVPLVLPGANTPRSEMVRSAQQAASLQMQTAVTVAHASSILSAAAAAAARPPRTQAAASQGVTNGLTTTGPTHAPPQPTLPHAQQPTVLPGPVPEGLPATEQRAAPAAGSATSTAPALASSTAAAVDGHEAATNTVLLQAALLAALRDMRELRDRRRRERTTTDNTPVPQPPRPLQHQQLPQTPVTAAHTSAWPAVASVQPAALPQVPTLGAAASGSLPAPASGKQASTPSVPGAKPPPSQATHISNTPGGSEAVHPVIKVLRPIRTQSGADAKVNAAGALAHGISPRGLHGPMSPHQQPLLPSRRYMGTHWTIGGNRVSPRQAATRSQLAGGRQGATFPLAPTTAMPHAPTAADGAAASENQATLRSAQVLRPHLRLLLASTAEEVRTLKERHAKEQQHKAQAGNTEPAAVAPSHSTAGGRHAPMTQVQPPIAPTPALPPTAPQPVAGKPVPELVGDAGHLAAQTAAQRDQLALSIGASVGGTDADDATLQTAVEASRLADLLLAQMSS